MAERKDNAERLKALREELRAGKKPTKKEKAKKAKEIEGDVNKDGKVDEEDLSIVHKAFSKAKKVVKKED